MTNMHGLEWAGEARLAAAVEATHGCRHRCRHCPIPVLYDGRLRVVGVEPVLADIASLAADGVQHVTFADPDFFNAPRYSLDILREAHAAHPALTFDVTVKVEHILAHRDLWPEVAELGVLFVTSAFESVDESTLAILDKGHTVSDMREAVTVAGAAGIHLRPTWLPFLPWTRPDDIADLVRFLDQEQLWAVTDPVQLSIKLLLPEGSLLEAHPAITPHLIRYDAPSLTWALGFRGSGDCRPPQTAGSDRGRGVRLRRRKLRDAGRNAAGDRLRRRDGLGPTSPVHRWRPPIDRELVLLCRADGGSGDRGDDRRR